MSHPTLAHWNPEDTLLWQRGGARVAARNLWLSVAALVPAFAVWMLWSVVVVHLGAAGFRFTTNQLFWLAALPALSGATLRVFYAFAVPVFGGRRWTALSTASLALPAAGLALAVQDPTTSYATLVLLAVLCGLGGGHFASAMAHISFLFPQRRQGWALGLSAGLGHLGVSAAQALVPLAIAVPLLGPWGGVPQRGVDGTPLWLQNAGWMWLPLIAVCAFGAWRGMDDLPGLRSPFGEQAVVFRRADNWALCWLYLGSFGSFIGFAAAGPLLVQHQFPHLDATALVWMGPLLSAVLRPMGGWLSDRLGGARVTLAAFAALALAVLLLALALPGPTAPEGRPLLLGLAGTLLFGAAGVGSSSVFKLVPAVYAGLHAASPATPARVAGRQAGREHAAATEAAATLGLASAVGAYGGFVVPKALGSAIQWTGSPTAALALFGLFYLSCLGLVGWRYARGPAPASR